MKSATGKTASKKQATKSAPASARRLAQEAKRKLAGMSKFNPDDERLVPFLSSEEEYRKVIDRLKIKPEYKKALKEALKVTVTIGKYVVQIGKKVIDVVIFALRKHPRTVAVLVVGSILSLIAGHIPLIGQLLAPILFTVTLIVATIVFVDEALKGYILDVFAQFALTPKGA